MDSTLSPAAIVELAQQHRLPAIALTDPNLHGAVEFQQLAKAAGVKHELLALAGAPHTPTMHMDVILKTTSAFVFAALPK